MKSLFVVALAAILCSGCLGSDADPRQADPDGTMDAAREGTFHFAPGGALELEQHGGDGRTAIGWSWADWVAGTQAPTWTTAPFEHGVVLTGVNVTVMYYAEAAAVFPDTLRPQFTVWFGVGAEAETPAFIDHGFQQGPPALVMGETYTVTFDIGLPLGGMAVAPGQRVVLPVASYYPDGLGLGSVGVVFAESRIDWTGHAWTPQPMPSSTGTSVSGSLLGGRCVAPLNPDEDAQTSFPFEITQGTLAVEILLERTAGAGMGPDLDMFVQDPEGNTVAYAAGSGTPERIQLHEDNLAAGGPGTWTLTVYNCQPQSSSFDAFLTVWT